MEPNQKNIFGEPLELCCIDPMTGFYRTGKCQTGPDDLGSHLICAIMTAEFLTFSKSKGNDLSTPIPVYNFPGLKPGDRWCLCALRWKEALEANKAPLVVLEATHEKALNFVTMDELIAYAYRTQPKD